MHPINHPRALELCTGTTTPRVPFEQLGDFFEGLNYTRLIKILKHTTHACKIRTADRTCFNIAVMPILFVLCITHYKQDEHECEKLC